MYYYTGRSGDSFTDATIHADADCCPDPTRPIADGSIRSDADFCPDCTGADEGGEDESPAPLGGDAETMIENGVCPWCSDYEGEYVGQHASSQHPDLWDEYKN